MKAEYINAYGYILLLINIFTMVVCLGSAFLWGSLCMYDDDKPEYFKYSLRMLAASLVAIVANSFALGRMFDSFLIAQLSIDKGIIQSTLIDRGAMFVTFGILFFSAIKFKEIYPTADN